MDENNRSRDWYLQAQDDLQWARDSIATKHFAQASFVAQQASEKALKSLALHRSFVLPRTHSVLQLAFALKVNGEIEKAARFLDRFYISARYPDAYPAGFPSQYIGEEDAQRAFESATKILDAVQCEFSR